jgi:hypothetical protein
MFNSLHLLLLRSGAARLSGETPDSSSAAAMNCTVSVSQAAPLHRGASCRRPRALVVVSATNGQAARQTTVHKLLASEGQLLVPGEHTRPAQERGVQSTCTACCRVMGAAVLVRGDHGHRRPARVCLCLRLCLCQCRLLRRAVSQGAGRRGTQGSIRQRLRCECCVCCCCCCCRQQVQRQKQQHRVGSRGKHSPPAAGRVSRPGVRVAAAPHLS